MSKIQPSSRHKQALNELYTKGTGSYSTPPEGGFIGEFITRAVQRFVSEAFEQEISDYLGRGYYQRQNGSTEFKGYRNGYETSRLKTAEGAIPIERPQLRNTPEPFHSRLWELFKQRTPALENLVIESYVRGLSTRDIEDLLTDESGRTVISKDGVSELTDQLWKDYQTFCRRDLSVYEVEYLFLDAVFESIRRQAGLKESILAAWAICRDGQRVLIHLALGNRESHDCWLSFLRDLMKRGLRMPVLITSDGAPGLISAIEQVWPSSLRQRCLVHKKRNILAKVPFDAVADMRAYLDSVWYAPTFEAGREAAQIFIKTFEPLYPSAVACFKDDLDASLQHLKCPATHRKAIRTTNLLERAFGEQKRRTKTIPRFFTEKSCLKLVFATLIRTAARWNKIHMTLQEQKQLNLLRNQLAKPVQRQSKIKQSKVA
jgi:transposase-like protein